MENYQNHDEFNDFVNYLRHEGLRMKGKMKRFDAEPAYATKKPERGYLASLIEEVLVAAD